MAENSKNNKLATGAKSSNKKETSRTLIIVQDVFIWLSTLIFIAWLLFKLRDDLGLRWLNLAKLSVNIVFSVVFLIKLIFLNGKNISVERTKKIRFAFKITKYILKLFLLTTIIIGILFIFRDEGISYGAITAAIISNLLFLVLLAIETIMLVHKYKKSKEKE